MRKTAFFISSIMGLALCLPAAAQQVAADFEEVLAKVASYEIGHSEQPLAEMDRMVAAGSLSPERVKQMEQAFLKALEATTSLAGKDQLCRRLMLVGSAAAVPTLAKMLSSAETADMARYALERIPGAAVNQALREMLAKTSGTVKAV